MPAAVATCAGSPLCEAQASASSSSLSCNASAAPLATSGSACSTLTAERGKIGRCDVAQRQHDAAVGIDHRQRAAVRGFDGIAAPGFDQYRIHRACSCHGPAPTVIGAHRQSPR